MPYRAVLCFAVLCSAAPHWQQLLLTLLRCAELHLAAVEAHAGGQVAAAAADRAAAGVRAEPVLGAAPQDPAGGTGVRFIGGNSSGWCMPGAFFSLLVADQVPRSLGQVRQLRCLRGAVATLQPRGGPAALPAAAAAQGADLPAGGLLGGPGEDRWGVREAAARFVGTGARTSKHGGGGGGDRRRAGVQENRGGGAGGGGGKAGG